MKKLKKNIALITARGGSKRIKNKNLLNFFGKPIIAYSILAAKRTNVFDSIYVSTDSKKIKKISQKYGAIVPFLRDKKLSDDFTGTHSVVKNFLNNIDLKNINNICCIYPTAPLINFFDIIKGLKILKKNYNRYIFSGTKIDLNNYVYFSLNKNKNLDEINYVKFKKNLKSVFYTDAAQFYWGSKHTWLNKNKIISSKSRLVEIPFERAQDLNSNLDLKILKLKKLVTKYIKD